MIPVSRINNINIYDVRGNLSNIERSWCTLVDQCNTSFFLSWGWIQAWLKELPKECKVYYIEKKVRQEPVMAFFIGLKNKKRKIIFNIQQLCLNISGNSEYDNIWVEYNCILCRDEKVELDLCEILSAINLSWDEFYLPGLDIYCFPGNSISTLSTRFQFIQDELAVSPYVDLRKVRKIDGDYISLLSSNSRSQIRRSFRIYENNGIVGIENPDKLEKAFEIYREMVNFHQSTWKNRGEVGVFSSKYFCKFHERLINDRFDRGEIKLLRIYAGNKTIGCLYCFLWKRKVYFYQCGFNYDLDKKAKPGLVSHVLAIKYFADKGYTEYDFLAGDARYKRSLATDYNQLLWGRIQKKSLKLRLEKQIRILFGKAKKRNRK